MAHIYKKLRCIVLLLILMFSVFRMISAEDSSDSGIIDFTVSETVEISTAIPDRTDALSTEITETNDEIRIADEISGAAKDFGIPAIVSGDETKIDLTPTEESAETNLVDGIKEKAVIGMAWLEGNIPWRIIVPAETALIIILTVLLISTGMKNKKPTGHSIPENTAFDVVSFNEIGGREYQEDRVWFVSGEHDLCAVAADGMGGMENGAESAQIAVDTYREELETTGDPGNVPAFLEETAQKANRKIYENNKQKGYRGGTTLAAVYIRDNKLFWISAGDSHIYLLRNGLLARVNEIHELENSLYQQLIDNDRDMEIVDTVPDSELRKLTSCLCKEKISVLDLSRRPFHLEKGDRILLATDGIESGISDDILKHALGLSDPKACRAELLAAVAKAHNSSQDNYSGIVIYYQERHI